MPVPLFSLKPNEADSVTGALAPPTVPPESGRLMRHQKPKEVSDYGSIVGAADLIVLALGWGVGNSPCLFLCGSWVALSRFTLSQALGDSDLSPHSEESLLLHSHCLQRHSPFSFSRECPTTFQ